MENAVNAVTPELRIAYLNKLAKGECTNKTDKNLDWLFYVIVIGSQTFLWTMYFFEKRMEDQKRFYEKMLKENRQIISDMYQQLNY